jgi:hypothetical protein
MSYKTILAEIQASQLTTFCPLATFRHKSHIDILPRNHRGLYWFWCNSSFENLATIQTRIGTGEVPISKLISDREGLNNICKIKIQDFTIIYNGIGGYEREPATFGLRERVLQELNATNIRTGTLNLLNRLNIHSTIDNWGISFFDFDT